MRQQETVCNYPSDARSLNQSINQSCNDVNSCLATVEGSNEKNIQSSMWKTLEILEIEMPCLVKCFLVQISLVSKEKREN